MTNFAGDLLLQCCIAFIITIAYIDYYYNNLLLISGQVTYISKIETHCELNICYYLFEEKHLVLYTLWQKSLRPTPIQEKAKEF